MSTSNDQGGPSRRELFENSISGEQHRPNIPVLWSDTSQPSFPIPRSLRDYRSLEGKEHRERRLKEIWKRLPKTGVKGKRLHPDKAEESSKATSFNSMTKEGAESLRDMYREELMDQSMDWNGFLDYADRKEAGEQLHRHAV